MILASRSFLSGDRVKKKWGLEFWNDINLAWNIWRMGYPYSWDHFFHRKTLELNFNNYKLNFNFF